jgi:hypothetical protein
LTKLEVKKSLKEENNNKKRKRRYTMTLSIDQLKAAFKTPERTEGANLPNNYFPFWNMKNGETATIRFLPDSNSENALGFLVEKVMHNLEINGDRKSVPCLSMYGEDCPICSVSQAYYKADDKINGAKYWKKKQHIAQALVVDDPLPADETTQETHEGKLRYVTLGYQLFNVIKEAFESGDLDDVPFAYEGGCNFIIKKSQQGEYSTYAVGTKFARKASDLDEDTVANLDLIDLSTLLPKNPGREKIEAMLEAALTGADYAEDNSSKPAPAAESKSAAEAKSSPAKTATPEDDSELEAEADDILAQIRNRKKAKSE